MFAFESFPILETPRLILREIMPEDADALMTIRGDYEVTRYNIGAAYTNIRQAKNLIDGMTALYEAQQEIRWGITLKPNNNVIGMAGFNYWNHIDQRGSIGFDLARAYWRKGIMSEALRAVISFGFEQMALNRIEADASAENEGSVTILQKLGFQQEGRQREQYYEDGTFHDLLLFALLRREWTS